MIDAHCHLYFDLFDWDRDLVRERAQQCGVSHAVLIGIDLASSVRALEMARADPWLSATAGIHPHDAAAALGEDGLRARFAELVAAGGFCAIGEAGLDYFRDRAPRAAQREVFRWQIRLAAELDLPLVVHTRDAHEDTLSILREEEARGARTVIHCFGGGVREAEDYLELGCYLSFSGVLTYRGNQALRAAARLVPPERMMVETDAPFLSPQPHRGERNEPALVRFTLARLAAVRGEDPAWVEERTEASTRAFFGIT